jgi:hypothetical protein
MNNRLEQNTFYFDVNQDVKKLSRSKSTNSPKSQRPKSRLMRHNSSNDSILGINSYFDKEIPPPPPYDAHSNSTMVTTTTTTTTVTTITTTTISNSGDSTQDVNNNTDLPCITVASYESVCATNNNETEKIPNYDENLSENSNSASLKVQNSSHDGKKHHKRSGSAPNVPVISLKEQAENTYKNNTVPSANSMVNLLGSGGNTVSLNKSYKETPQKYLEKLRDTLSKSELATLLTKSKDVFHETVLRTYMETFDFIKDPIDIALR